ncbi:hypothetical protein HanXRQr2_Chr14g0633281 [Helianthus annuus]|uniref:Uncharacterized protein n=1 Tax=Helianthus annuus TaxID=4232 RepID=A0A9K3E923_HELAN|nr:hypothetical protein HanXRQr2_Chr14g0633281 [Helianthus annuus]KAJ0484966.1 hypothetical protein HanHA89_Chr14g0562821 [Helianthus annuus]KAJ0655517.1 hypothetical protein HanLR1_Chr14g0525161 [Helianthus annuus]
MCECLNAQTMDGGDKPIISALEYVREYLMQRIVIVIRALGKCNGPLTPHATERLIDIKEQAVNYSDICNLAME